MSDYIKVCRTCDHYPNDKHCIGCEWDKNTGVNTKWENCTVIDRKVIEDIKAEIKSQLITHGQVIEGEYFPDDAENINYGLNTALEIIDKHISGKGQE